MKIRLRTVVIAALVALLAVAALPGCRRKAGPPKDIVNRSLTRTVVVEVGGARTARVESDILVSLMIRKSTPTHRDSALYAFQPKGALRVDQQVVVQPEFNVIAMYAGDGTYEIPAGIGQAPTTGNTVPAPDSPALASLVGVTFVSSTPPSETRYGYLAQPCEFTTTDDGASGSLDCPAVLSIAGEAISLKLSWGD